MTGLKRWPLASPAGAELWRELVFCAQGIQLPCCDSQAVYGEPQERRYSGLQTKTSELGSRSSSPSKNLRLL